jgi:hypothetical protein
MAPLDEPPEAGANAATGSSVVGASEAPGADANRELKLAGKEAPATSRAAF